MPPLFWLCAGALLTLAVIVIVILCGGAWLVCRAPWMDEDGKIVTPPDGDNHLKGKR